jgi:Flp pilus assembly secretin CpaC
VNNAVLVGSGETVVVGGLLDKSVTDTADKVPLLGDIPVIGALFRSTSKKVSKRNLMLFIRPTIIRDRDEYRQASSGQYTAFNEAQTKQRGKENNEALLSNDLLHIYPQQETQAFRQVSAAIDAFNLGGNHDASRRTPPAAALRLRPRAHRAAQRRRTLRSSACATAAQALLEARRVADGPIAVERLPRKRSKSCWC